MPIFDAIQKGTGAPAYAGKVGAEDADQLDMAYRVVADHIRTLTGNASIPEPRCFDVHKRRHIVNCYHALFLRNEAILDFYISVALSDGGRPDNVGRGYVLRRILRRGIRFATEKLNAKPGFFASLVDVVVQLLGDFFPELRRDPDTVKDIINEEETQFLKTLTRGRRLLDRTIAKLPAGTKVLPGDIAWRLYDTYGFPLDLTQLMSEERGLGVDVGAYEVAKQAAQLASQGVGGVTEDKLALDVHAITELQNKGTKPTDDSPKYSYSFDGAGGDAKYKFESCQGTVIALRKDKRFVDSVSSGDECGVLLDRTCFYAEQGGQIFDEGFLVKADDDTVEFKVTNVQVRAGFVLHTGHIEGSLKVGDVVVQQLDETRRRNVMNNHTGTHILNFGLRKALASDADQKGSLVAPDKLRFDFSFNRALTIQEVKAVETVACELIAKDGEVYAKEASLAVAKAIQGLRAVFDETYPDPVRVVSVGIPVEQMEADPTGPAGSVTSVEFCGGTHLRRAGHIGKFVIASEEAIAKGIRRVIALTGPEATKAVHRAEKLQKELEGVKATVENPESNLSQKEMVRRITELTETISAAAISYWRKDEMRNELKAVKKTIDDKDRARKAALTAEVVETTKALLTANPDLPYLVFELNAAAENKTLDNALKQVKALSPATPTIFFSGDFDTGKVLCMAQVPPEGVSKGLKANEWCQQVMAVLGGKGGGKPESAQAVGTNVSGLQEALTKAEEFARQKLSITQPVVVKK
jgi:alanyl-tRNA synthetase